MMIGVNDKSTVCVIKTHFPLFDVGLNEQIPLVIIWVPLDVDPPPVVELISAPANFKNTIKSVNHELEE